MTVAAANENAVEPPAPCRLMIPTRKTIHHLILDMEEESFVHLTIGIRCHAEIMGIGASIDTVEIARQVIHPANTHFPRAEDAIAKLRSDGNIEIIAVHAAA